MKKESCKSQGSEVADVENMLKHIQETAQIYVDILAEILKVDVTIITSDCIHIAGSGRMKKRIGDMSSYGLVVQETLHTRRLTVMEDPTTSPICISCERRQICDNVCEAWFPICIDDQVLGVLGFVCFDQAQKAQYLQNRDTFLHFLTQVGDLLTAKAKDELNEQRSQTVISLLENTLNHVDSGILVMDRNLKISRINRAGKKMLSIHEVDSRLPPLSLSHLGEQSDGADRYALKIGDISYTLAGRLYDLDMADYRRLFVFQKAGLEGSTTPGGSPPREVDRILGASPEIRAVKKQILAVAPSVSNVLVTGESGTGKELVAVALHGESDRAGGPLVAINCASIPENLLESELFGYVRGAFTGADSKGRPGLFEAANGGTVFLDEIGDMPFHLQAKLLRVLESRQVTRLGSSTPIKIDVRLVAATNQDLEAMVMEGKFRGDLYYRLNVIPIRLPPLRERPGDIRLLASSFIDRYCAVLNKDVRGIEDAFWDRLEQYAWPGNVRELQNTIEYVINMMPYSGILGESVLPVKFFREVGDADADVDGPTGLPDEDLNLAHMEQALIRRALTVYGSSSKAKAVIAQKMGISLATLYRKIKQYQLS